MSDDNVKLQTAKIAVAPKQETAKSSTGSSEAEEAKKAFGPGTSDYQEKDQGIVDWNMMVKGNSKAAISTSPLDNPDADPIELISGYCEDVNTSFDTEKIVSADVKNFRPKSPFDALRMHFEIPDPTDAVDLKQTLNNIPSYDVLKVTIQDKETIESYYLNRIGAIKDLIEYRQDMISNTQNSYEIAAYKKYEMFLQEKLQYVKNQLAALYKDDSTSTV